MKTTPVKKIATVLGAGSLLLGGLALAPSATAAAPAAVSSAVSGDSPQATGARTALVTAWYQQFLGRSPDAGAQYWVVRLRTEEPVTVLADLLITPESATKQVDDLYTTFLGRGTAEDGGASAWVTGIVDGSFPAEWVEQNILASPEYVSRHSTPDGDAGPVVRTWYRDILGRPAADGEVDYWADQLSLSSALGVVREIWYSSEAVDLRVASHYRDYLQRPASSGEISYWYGQEVAADISVVVSIASSDEYRKNAPTFLP